MRRTTITVLVIVFAISSLVSTSIIYYAHQQPTQKKLVHTLYTYGHYGTFDYLATLKPNIIYNRTLLRPGEGPIFTRITDEININFNYTFQGSEPANLTVYYRVTEQVETSKFQKQIGDRREGEIHTTGSNTNLYVDNVPPVNVSSVQNLINKVTQETGMSISDYTVTLTAEMHIRANTTEGSINEYFTPKMTIRFTSSFSEGNIISIEDTEHSKTGEITSTTTVYHSWVDLQRNLSYGLAFGAFSGLLVTLWVFTKSGPPEPVKPEALIEDAIEPFKEIITETAQEPRFEEPTSRPVTAISMKNLEDLVKVADILAKPIIHSSKSPETHLFYVMDEGTRYEYKMKASSLIQEPEKEEEG
ncbi:hypothetical protein GWN63_06155 [Candidatus Bathyarchaeota archaeon]|nr:DUF5305 domain-containing protein [Candidatus Bathyarchaeota archaeon]NIU81804.1 hypothetical protein [Candidatus Bathyarchaeota archaeon]